MATCFNRMAILDGSAIDLWKASDSALFDPFDPVVVRIAHEAQAIAALADRVRRALGLDPLLLEPGQSGVEVRGGDRDVPVGSAELVGVHAEVVGQLELGLG